MDNKIRCEILTLSTFQVWFDYIYGFHNYLIGSFVVVLIFR